VNEQTVDRFLDSDSDRHDVIMTPTKLGSVRFGAMKTAGASRITKPDLTAPA